MHTSKRNLEGMMEKYGDMLFRLSMVFLKNKQDAEDAVQETFFRYLKLTKIPSFHDDQHEKAWFLKVATNICRDMRRFQFRHPTCDIEDYKEYLGTEDQRNILEELMELPVKYKIPIYFYYIEGYSVKDIANFTHCSENAVKKQLQRGREVLKIKYEKMD